MVATPMLVSAASVLPQGQEWAFEVKWDGMRAQLAVDPAVRVLRRHGHDHTAAFPELASLATLARRARVVLVGELVCRDRASGRPSFERLMARTQSRLPAAAARAAPVTFMAFDVLALDGVDVCGRPWVERRQFLHELRESAPDVGWRVNTAFVDGPGLLAATADMGLEGVVAERATSRYWPGRRTAYCRTMCREAFGCHRSRRRVSIQLVRTRKLIATADSAGNVRMVEMNRRVEQNLSLIIDTIHRR